MDHPLPKKPHNAASSKRLALDGGPPAFPEGPPSWPPPSPAVELSVQAALRDGSWGKYDARWTKSLIQEIADWLKMDHVMLCASGTIGIELALRGIGLQLGQEVILAGYDFPGNFRTIESMGATPVLVDLAPDRWILDVDQLESAISDKTGAVIVSHMHGQMVDMSKVQQICRARSVAIVEDACQTPGAVGTAGLAGTAGDVGVFSFGGSKLLTSGRGGAVVTNRSEIAQRIRVFGRDSG